MRRVVRHLVRQFRARVALLVVRYDVREAMQLVEDGGHVGGSVGGPVYGDYVGFTEDRVVVVVGDLDVASCFY